MSDTTLSPTSPPTRHPPFALLDALDSSQLRLLAAAWHHIEAEALALAADNKPCNWHSGAFGIMSEVVRIGERAAPTQHRASQFALDRVSNYAQLATCHAETWDDHRNRTDNLDDADLTGWARAQGRAEAARELIAILRAGDASHLRPAWVDDLPADPDDEGFGEDILTLSKQHSESLLNEAG